MVDSDTHHPRHQVPRGQRAPLARPIRTAVGAIPLGALLLIDVGTDQGIVGRSYIFTYTIATLAPVARLAAEIIPNWWDSRSCPWTSQRNFEPPVPVARPPGAARHAAVRPGHGPGGMLSAAPSAGPSSGCSAASRCRCRPMTAYGIVDPIADEGAIRQSLERGFRAIKIKIGDGGVRRTWRPWLRSAA